MTSVFAYLFFFIAATASPLQRRHLATKRQTDAGQIAFAFHVMLITTVLSLGLWASKSPELNTTILSTFSLSFICGLFGSVALATQYAAQRHVEAGTLTVVGNIYTPVTIILATVLLNERLQPLQIVGTLMLLVAAVLVSQKHRLTRWKFDRYFFLIVISGIAMGLVITAERVLIRENGITAGTWLSWSSQTLFLAFATFVSKQKSQHNLRETSITGSLRFLQQLSWVILITVVANLSVVSAVTTFKVVIVFAAAAIFLHERDDMRRKVIGSLVAVVGLLLMAV